MREVCKSGAVVAAVVAVLEKQSKRGPPPQNSTRKLPECTKNNPGAENRREQDGPDQRSENFELAVRDFNSVAEDVEKAFSPCFPPRKNCLTIDLRSEEDAEEEEVKFRGRSLVFEKSSEELLMVVGYEGEQDIDSDSLERSSDSEGELYVNAGLATIAEEERGSCSSTRSSKGCEDDSSIDESTLKDRNHWSGSVSNRDSTSDLSTSSSERQGTLGDSGSTRCTSDFQWIRKEPPPAPSPVKMEEEVPPVSKPPISRRDKTPKRAPSGECPPVWVTGMFFQ